MLATLPENIGFYVIEVLKVTKTTKTKESIKVELIKKYNQIALRPTRAKQKDQNNLETGLTGSTKVGKVKGKGWVLTTLPWQLLIGTAMAICYTDARFLQHVLTCASIDSC